MEYNYYIPYIVSLCIDNKYYYLWSMYTAVALDVQCVLVSLVN